MSAGLPESSQSQLALRPRHRRRRLRRGLVATGTVAGVYASLAFLVLPTFWAARYRNIDLDDMPRVTWAGNHHPGDPINFALVGTKEEIVYLFLSAHWGSADKVTWGSS